MEKELKAAELSPPKQFEKWYDEVIDLIRRRPRLGWSFVAFAVVFVAIPTLWGAWEKYKVVPELNEKLDKAKGDAVKLTNERNDAIRERDKAEIKLAPFMAAAETRFTNAPPDKRLDMLLEEVRSLKGMLPKPRRLSKDILDEIRVHATLLDKGTSIFIGFDSQASEGRALAEQLANMFRDLKFNVDGPSMSVSLTEQPPIIFYLTPDLCRWVDSQNALILKPEITGVIDVLSGYFGAPKRLAKACPFNGNAPIQTNSIAIFVGG